MTTHSEEQKDKQTSLFANHVALGGKIVSFAGWKMPVQYEGITVEHKAVRSAAGLFDVSHMGEIDFHGPDALANVQKLVSNNVAKLKDGEALYTGMLYPEGTFVDDLLVYRRGEEHYWLVVNAANTAKDFAWVRENISGNVTAENISDTICQIALQGPGSIEIFRSICEAPAGELKYFTFLEGTVLGKTALISRTGYTGEDGLELYVPWDNGPEIWNALIEAGSRHGLKPVGLGARDTLRMEAGLPLYGNDIGDTTTPLEAGLNWIVKFKKGDFIGRDTLIAQKEKGIERKLVGFRMIEKGIPRPHYPVIINDNQIGTVASGGLAIWLNERVGTAYVPVEFAEPGTVISIDIRNTFSRAEVVPLPFYKRAT